MKIFITASKSAYGKVAAIKEELEAAGHSVTSPNGYDTPDAEAGMQQQTPEEYATWKAEMIREDGRIIQAHDAILVLNMDKNGVKNYIGGATFLEMFKAFDAGKKIFLYNPLPELAYTDELVGLLPVVIDGDLRQIN